jgi:collagenase-like PrtC family protease
MQTPQKHIELLAPAKNADIGIAAINAGADAVYIAGKKFGAREDAGNTLPDIEKLITYAHRYYARVYVALNTILRNDELEDALTLIRNVYAMGADGLIIQDVGLLELRLPPIPLIASTQMNNDSLEKILFLQQIGFKRVILPREFTLSQINEIQAGTTIELECFIHGSLCVSDSGQCALSYAIGGRSANRGACAQPCRRSYTLVDEKGTILAKDKYLLSLKDLNRADHLKELIRAGVTSFKIEGRLKDKSYVANITGFYRQKLDELIDGKDYRRSSSGRTTFDFAPNPYKTFNRGYTDYGLEGTYENMASLHTPKSLGEKIGSVAKVENDHFILASTHDLNKCDGICFFDHAGILRGTVLNKVEGKKITPDKMHYLEEKTVIYRNYDKAFVKTLERSPGDRKIDVSFTLEETAEGFKLWARDEDGNAGTYYLPTNKTKAEKKHLADAAIQKQLASLRETIFACRDITVTSKETYFIPLSVLNQLRRGAIENLLEEREKNRPRGVGHVLSNHVPYPIKDINFLGNCLNSKAEAFYERHGAKVTELAAENGLNMSRRRVMRTKYCVKKELGLCAKGPKALYLVDEDQRKYPLKFNCPECRMEVYFPDKTHE